MYTFQRLKVGYLNEAVVYHVSYIIMYIMTGDIHTIYWPIVN